MEIKTAVTALAALAQETRLSIYRLLVEAGPQGMAAGRISEKLNVPGATLSFHLKELSRALGFCATRKAIHLLRGRLRTYGRAHDFSHAELLSGHAAGVSHGCRNGAGALLSSAIETQETQTKKESLMKRFHVHVSVDDLDATCGFIPRFLGCRRLCSNPITPNGCWKIPGSTLQSPNVERNPVSITSAYRLNHRRKWPSSVSKLPLPKSRSSINRKPNAVMRGATNTGRPIRKGSHGRPSTRSTPFRSMEKLNAPNQRRVAAPRRRLLQSPDNRAPAAVNGGCHGGRTAQCFVFMYREFSAQHYGGDNSESRRQGKIQSLQRGESCFREGESARAWSFLRKTNFRLKVCGAKTGTSSPGLVRRSCTSCLRSAIKRRRSLARSGPDNR